MEYTKKLIMKNGKECLIRNGVPDDAQEVYDLFNLMHDQTDYLASYGDETDFDVEFERRFLTDKQHSDREVYLCAVLDGRIVGTAGLDPMGKNKVSHRAEFGIGIDREYWGLGIGRALITACIECAKAAGYAQLELKAVSENEGALALYRKLGFREYGRNPRGFCSRYTGWQELVLMRLEMT